MATSMTVALLGGLLINTGAAIGSASPIDSPTQVIARAADTEAIISWTAPINTGGELVTGYTVTSTPDSQTCSTTGSPATTSCKVTGLTNNTAYTFTVTATTSSATSSASAASTSVTPIAGTTGVNFIGADASSVKWGSDYVYASAPRSGISWPYYVYNNSSYSSTSVGTLISSATVNSASASYPNDCSSAWQWVQILCDSDAGNLGTARRNSSTHVYKPGFNAGFTIDSVTATSSFIVIDLGAVKNFTTLRVFQMFSDGKVTEAAIYKHPQTNGTWPTVSDAGWVEVKRSKISAGKQLNATSEITCPTSLDFSATSSRYIKLNFKNQGEFGDPSWIEVGAAKLFFETSIPVPEADCPPEPPTNASATAGNSTATVSWNPSVGSVAKYLIQYSKNGGTWTNATTDPSVISSTATNATVTGLTNGASYTFRIQAVNSGNAASPYTPPSSSITPLGTLPNPPTSVTVTPIAYAANISWPAVDGATTYTVTSSPGAKTCTATAPATSCVINNLTAGLDYTFTVASGNANGTSGPSVQSLAAAPTTVDPAPGAPEKPTATISGTTATVTVAVGAGGGTPSSYTVTSSPGGLTCTVTGSSGSCTISGLTAGTVYTFTATATNAAGTSSSSSASESITTASAPSGSSPSDTSSTSAQSGSETATSSSNSTSTSKKRKSGSSGNSVWYASSDEVDTEATPVPSISPNSEASPSASAESQDSNEFALEASNSQGKSTLDTLAIGAFVVLAGMTFWFILGKRRRRED